MKAEPVSIFDSPKGP